jgi:hypothetical protein
LIFTSASKTIEIADLPKGEILRRLNKSAT